MRWREPILKLPLRAGTWSRLCRKQRLTRGLSRQSRGLPFRVLTDLDLAYAFSLGLVFWVGDKIKEAYRQFGIDLERFQGHGGWLLPIPATIVVGKDGKVKGRFVDPDFRHRMAIEDILSALAAPD